MVSIILKPPGRGKQNTIKFGIIILMMSVQNMHIIMIVYIASLAGPIYSYSILDPTCNKYCDLIG